MKKATLYFIMMVIIIVIVPMLIVKSCSNGEYIKPPVVIEGEEKSIKVYMHLEKKIVEMPLEEYLKGVVAAEMPAEFENEALKAQAVAARTYAYGRMIRLYSPKDDLHEGADVCTDSTHCQAWISKDAIMKKWGIFSASKNWTKISKAVNETKNKIIVYQSSLVNPVFHSNSGGRTENSEDVWEGGQVPYLRSVQSDGEDVTSEYKNIVVFSVKEFCSRLKAEYPKIKLNEKDVYKDIKVVSTSEGGRVKSLKIGNITLKGTDFRAIFDLKSTNFKIERQDKASLKITTYGNGHGVGMSQWGANYLAKKGNSYEEILKYYYQGVELENLENMK